MWVLTSHSSRRRRGADRYTADNHPSSCRPVSSSSHRRHRVLKPETLLTLTTCFLFCSGQIKCLRELLASPWESKWHTMGAAELPLANRRNPEAARTKWTPASAIFIWSTSLLLSYLYIRRLLRMQSWRWGSVPSCGPKVWLKTLPAMISIKEWFGVICGKQKGILYPGTVPALWRTPRCASAGMNFPW